MPLYDYECPDCGERFEELRPIAERATAPCPKCKGTAQKQLSGFFTASSSSSSSGACDTGGRGACGGGFPGGG